MIDDPFEYVTFGGTFRRTFEVFFGNFDTFMGLSFVVVIPFAIIYLTMLLFVAYVYFGEETDPEFEPKHIPALVVVYVLEFVLYRLASVIGQGAISYAVAEIYLGRRPKWVQCLKAGWKRKCSLLGSSVILHGSLILAFIPCFIFLVIALTHQNFFTFLLATVAWLGFVAGCVYAYTGFILTSPAIMVEGHNNPIKGLKRSWELSNGSRCYLICAMFALWFLNQFVSQFLFTIFGSKDDPLAIFTVVGGIINVLPAIFYFPLHAIVESVLYLNLRIGREALNYQVLTGDVLSDEPPAARFRNDDPADNGNLQDSFDYRRVPLVNAAESEDEVLPEIAVV